MASSRGLGSLTLDLIVRIGGFERGMDKAARHADQRMREIEKRAKQLGTVLATGLVAAGTGAAVAIGQAINRMDELRDASIRLGIGVETLSAFSFAARQTGTDIEALGTGFKVLAKNMADALNPKSGKSQIFEALGIEVTDATGKLKQFEEIIPEIADKFRILEDGTTKAALAQELFGKSGLQLTEFLNQGGDGIQALTDRARELGLVFDQDAADKADLFKDTLGELKAAGEGLATQVAIQLLPKLLELTEWARGFVSDGNNAKNIANELAGAFEIVATAAGLVWKGMQIVGATVRGVTSDITAAVQALRAFHAAQTLQFEEAKRLFESAKLAKQMGNEQGEVVRQLLTGGGAQGARGPDFSRVTGAFRSSSTDTINRPALNNALGGVKPDKVSSKSSGKSEEEREADRLKQAYESLNSSLEERIALFGQEGEAAKVRYELEHGELAKLDPLKKQELINRAETLDLMRAEEEQMRKSMELAKKDAEEKLRAVEAADALIVDMEFELSLLGMMNKEHEREIALRYAGVDATDEQRAAIVQLSDAYYQARQEAEFWAEVQGQLSDTFVDVISGTKSLKDAVKDFFDSLAQYILRSISEQWAEKIANLFMTKTGTGGTSGGGGWQQAIGGFISALFGGGKASGGPVSAGMLYRVNENGPELLSVGGRDYLMMGSSNGNVTPHHASTGGLTQINNFNYRAPYDPRVESQKGAALAASTQSMLRRNG